MKRETHIKVWDEFIEVWNDRARIHVYPDGRVTLDVISDGLPVFWEWAGEGRFDWCRFHVSDTGPLSWDEDESEEIYRSLETALKRWTHTDEGREWMQAHGLVLPGHGFVVRRRSCVEDE
jgi:hypothetical protein